MSLGNGMEVFSSFYNIRINQKGRIYQACLRIVIDLGIVYYSIVAVDSAAGLMGSEPDCHAKTLLLTLLRRSLSRRVTE